ncbi:pyridoxal phosphate-dependent aminotransferase family protein [Weeksellaceae bacterium TAE3-ERU29]|nr:pyridoxal phosphate-dependent aminotransferase family protein [Weeksellaceae bacterium TAE3-ERU29]
MFPEKAKKLIEERKTLENYRELKIYDNKVDFFSNDYLGIAKKLNKFKTTQSHSGSTGSRLISGNSVFCEEVENFLADFYNVESSLIFNSGYTANLAVLSAIPQRGDTILYDELIHASLRDGLRLSNAKSYKFKHNDLEDLILKSKKSSGSVFVVTEGIYSMDGDEVNPEILEACHKNNWFIILDEAHSTGALGRNGKGIYENYSNEIFARVHTFGKALGTHGAVVTGSKELKEFLVNFARPFIYTTAMSNAELEVMQQAHTLLDQSEKEKKNLNENIKYFQGKIKETEDNFSFLDSNFAIQGILGNIEDLKSLSNVLDEKDIAVKTIFSPTVPMGKERIRITLHSYNTKEEIDLLFNSINSLK